LTQFLLLVFAGVAAASGGSIFINSAGSLPGFAEGSGIGSQGEGWTKSYVLKLEGEILV
jgi:hypothetical protein